MSKNVNIKVLNRNTKAKSCMGVGECIVSNFGYNQNIK
jgi:hypothetical protein